MNGFRHLLHVALIASAIAFISTGCSSGSLFRNGKSDYKIVVSSDASVSEQTAAKELQDYLKQIGGAELPITDDLNADGRRIFIGYNPKVAELSGAAQPDPEDESFTYRTVGRDLLIWGGSRRGTMYGVFTFLEKELGVHWFTPQCTEVPMMKAWKMPRLDHSEKPAIQLRFHNYRLTAGEFVWGAHVKENMRGPVDNEYGGEEGYWGAHTMGYLVPEKEFFKTHPEYFSFRDGKRQTNSQLCLTNPDVLELCKQRLAQKMRELPGYRIYSLSQNDNEFFCECDNCKAVEQQYGGHSGLIVWFVNQVADALKDEFPDKYIGTFAYRYSRKPPVGIVPRDNVVIRLCSIECCYAHPLTAGCPQNEAFMKELREWAGIAPHLFIWDYIVDYAQYLAPWPNFQVLGPNIEAFRENKAIGIFEEAQYQTVGAEFEEMKSWVVNQLLWDPKQDVDSLATIFINGYYGKAAPRVQDYYNLCQGLVKPDVHYGIYIREDHEIYSDEFNQKAFDLLDEARSLAEDEEILKRVDRVRMQPLYLYCMRHRDQAKQDGKWEELKGLMLQYQARARENRTLEEFIESFEK